MGNLNLPPFHQMLANAELMMYRFTFKDKWQRASLFGGKVTVLKEALVQKLGSIYNWITGRLGIGAAARDYFLFERQFLRLLKSRGHRRGWALGQAAHIPFLLADCPPRFLPRVLGIVPDVPGPTGPLYASVQGFPGPRKKLGSGSSSAGTKSASTSPTGSDHDSGEDLAGSLHSLKTSHSRETTSSPEERNASGNGLSESWAHIESERTGN